jgi:hypothetical protein
MPRSAALLPLAALNVVVLLGVPPMHIAASGAVIPFVKAALKRTHAQ